MLKLKQTVIVEGKYDKARLASLLDATILTTDGFDIFRDKAKLHLIRSLAQKDGIVILTDSDAAGFRIRSHIAGAVAASQIIHVYIPDVLGKERRKPKPGAEGKLGVEGIPDEKLLEAFARAGILPQTSQDLATIRSGADTKETCVTRSDLMEWGLTGGENSFALRQKLLSSLGLPARMNANALLSMVNTLYTREEFKKILEKLFGE